MGVFNYSRFHFFDKEGNELILNHHSNVHLKVLNSQYPEFSGEYALVKSVPGDSSLALNSSLVQLKAGMKFNMQEGSKHLDYEISINTPDGSTYKNQGMAFFSRTSYRTSNGEDNYPDLRYNLLTSSQKISFLSTLGLDQNADFFPTYTFSSYINFDKISTGLIETQTIYVLVEDVDENGNKIYSTVKDYAEKYNDARDYINRFKLFFFIDNREQTDFRMFHTEKDELSWSDRSVLDFTHTDTDGSNDNGYSVNIGFSGELDGVYEQTLYVCLLDTNDADPANNFPGTVYPIGDIILKAEAEGEDERYRAFFANFGIPDPKYYNAIFSDTEIVEDLPDYVSINKNSKKIYLTYSEILPYLGSYKALDRLIRLLGYENDVFFREWYKEVGNNSIIDNGYVSYEVQNKTSNSRGIDLDTDLDERQSIKKMNMQSMIYKINEETDDIVDKFGFPTVITNYKNFNTEKILKLTNLKKWVSKNAIGVNTYIADINGEGLAVERYTLPKIGGIQQVLDYNNERTISPIPVYNTYVLSGYDSSVMIDVEIHTSDLSTTINDLEYVRFKDLCIGYFDEDKIYHAFNTTTNYNANESRSNFDVLPDNPLYRYFGKTYEMHDNMNSIFLRTKGKHDSFMLRKSGNSSSVNQYSYVDFYSPSLLVDDNEIRFLMVDCAKTCKNTTFTSDHCPVIQIENGIIKRYKDNHKATREYEYYATITKDEDSNGNRVYKISAESDHDVDRSYFLYDVPSLLPPSVDSNSIIHPVFAPDSSFHKVDDNYPYDVGEGEHIDIIKHKIHKSSNGLRFSIDNPDKVPCFFITGYMEKNIYFDGIEHNGETSSYKDDFPSIYIDEENHVPGEYILEIFDGRMIFYDSSTDQTVTLNFKYDKDTDQRSVYVETYKETSHKTAYKYRTSRSDASQTVNRFSDMSSYADFVYGYDECVDDYVKYDGIASVKVNNAGTYEIEAVLCDEFNNIFTKRSETNVIVLKNDSSIMSFIREDYSGEPFNIDGINCELSENRQILINQYNILAAFQHSMFKYVPKYQILNKSGENGEQISYNELDENGYMKSFKNDYSYTKTVISSMSDRYELVGEVFSNVYDEDVIQYLFSKRNTDSHTFAQSYTQEVAGVKKIYGFDQVSTYDSEDLHYIVTHEDMHNGTLWNVTVFVFDDLCELPIYSMAGTMIETTGENGGYPAGYYMFEAMSNEYQKSIFSESDIKARGNNSKYTYYIIPQWLAPCGITKISTIENTIDLTLLPAPSPFDGVPLDLSDKKYLNSMMTLTYQPMYYNRSTIAYGKGSYLVKKINGTSLTLQAAKYKPKSEYEVDHFDGSTWLSSSSLDYMGYSFDINMNSKSNGAFVTVINDTTPYRNKEKFISKDYSIEFRDIDTIEAIKYCGFDIERFGNSILFINSKIASYAYYVPITTYSNYVLLSNPEFQLEQTLSNLNKTEIRWRVYYRTDGTKGKLITECFNPSFLLYIDEPGIYDIEMTTWDRYGNKVVKNLDSWIRKKKGD